MDLLSFDKAIHYQSSKITENIIQAIKYWDKKGPEVVQKNRDGEWGSIKTQELAREMESDDFILSALYNDVKTFCRAGNTKSNKLHTPNTKWSHIRNDSHIWVYANDEVVLMIYLTGKKMFVEPSKLFTW